MIFSKMIDIVIASDSNYLPHAETLLVSIARNNMTYNVINIHLIGNGITNKDFCKLNDLLLQFPNFHLFYYQIDDKEILAKLGGNIVGDRSLATFARIFIPDLLNCEKALYLDVDAIVNDDLSQLYEIDLTNYAIAGVRDTNPFIRRKNVGLEFEDIYINAGMILWNLDYCRKINFVDQCCDFIRQHDGHVDAMDQGTINGVLGKQGLIKVISPKFNAFSSFFQLNRKQIQKLYKIPNFYDDGEISEARINPTFIHFTPNMITRPWVENCLHPFAYKYIEYRNYTNYPLHSLCKDNRKIKQHFLSWIYNFCPTIYILFFMKKD
ncbi:TPA: glycosyltransferase family 8 protein [Streptococcus suis]